MLAYTKQELCVGCTACISICPYNAINMVADKEGFLYPLIDENLCIDCGLCQKICPFQSGYKINGNYAQPKVYAVKHRDDNVRMNSSSGGMFTAISDFILFNNGIIYGAAFDEHFRVCHQKAENVEESKKFRGSKYVQSDLKAVFKDIKDELIKGRKILFTGTPCQNAGLRVYLGKNYENLFFCDIICHGTPSPLIFEDYIKYCEHKKRSKITEYYCRDKCNGWHSHTEKAVYANGKEDSTSAISQIYKVLFYSNYVLRPACHNCQFCNLSRPSDITIADFWGIEKKMPDFDDNIGVSLVLVNSNKGMELFDNVKSQIIYRESNTDDCMQYNLYSPTPSSAKRQQFWEDYWDKGFDFVLKEYIGYGFKYRIKVFVRNYLIKFGLLPIAQRLIFRK